VSATARPWKVSRSHDKKTGYRSLGIETDWGVPSPLHIANMVGQLDDKEAANAELIVRAVNAHEGLVSALEGEEFDHRGDCHICDELGTPCVRLKRIQDALVTVKGKNS
jgi:hypothetical protein